MITLSYVLVGLVCLLLGAVYARRAARIQDGGQKMLRWSLSGWGAGLRTGDKLIFRDNGSTVSGRVESIVYERQGFDEWRAIVEFRASIPDHKE